MKPAKPDVKELEAIARELRVTIVDMLHKAGSGHAGGSLSLCEILSVLYYSELNVDPRNPRDPNRDRLILSKGHGAPALYAILARKGFFPVECLDTLRKIGSKLQGHPDMNKTPGVDISSGSLGMGLSFGIGTALGARLNNLSYKTYVITGCGELDEGQNWEALMCAAKYGLSNLIAIVDYNQVQLDGTNEEIMPLADLKRKLASFNWRVRTCDGHSVPELLAVLGKARKAKERPTVIVAYTVKGKGISFMEHKSEWHGKEISDENLQKALAELKGAGR